MGGALQNPVGAKMEFEIDHMAAKWFLIRIPLCVHGTDWGQDAPETPRVLIFDDLWTLQGAFFNDFQ